MRNRWYITNINIHTNWRRPPQRTAAAADAAAASDKLCSARKENWETGHSNACYSSMQSCYLQTNSKVAVFLCAYVGGLCTIRIARRIALSESLCCLGYLHRHAARCKPAKCLIKLRLLSFDFRSSKIVANPPESPLVCRAARARFERE